MDNFPKMISVPGGFRIGIRSSFAIYMHLLKDSKEHEVVVTTWVFGKPLQVSTHPDFKEAAHAAKGIWRSMVENVDAYRLSS
jgi:hypothetical protein